MEINAVLDIKKEIVFEGVINSGNFRCNGVVTIIYHKYLPERAEVSISFFEKDLDDFKKIYLIKTINFRLLKKNLRSWVTSSTSMMGYAHNKGGLTCCCGLIL